MHSKSPGQLQQISKLQARGHYRAERRELNPFSHQREVVVLPLVLYGGMLGKVHQVSTDGLRIGLHVDGLEREVFPLEIIRQ